MVDNRNLRIAYFNGTMVEGQDGVTRTLFKIVDFLKEKEIESIFFFTIIQKRNYKKN